MAKINMKHIEIAAPISESKEIFDFLQMRSVIELHQTEQIDGLSQFSTLSTVSQIDKFADTAATALKIIDKRVPQKGSLLDSLKGLPELTASEYKSKSDDADVILSVCHDICECEKDITEAKSAIARNDAAREALEPWLSLDLSMKYQGTESTVAYIGTMPADYTAESLTTALIPLLEGEDRFECEIISHAKDRSCVFTVCHRECSDIFLSALRTLGFAYPSDPTKHPPTVRYERLGKENESLKQAMEEKEKKIEELAQNRDSIKFLNDYFSIRRDKYEALSKISAGDSVVIFAGYVPEDEVDRLLSQLDEKFTVAYNVTDPEEDADAPVLMKNKPFVAAVESITEMYSPPGKEDIDPNPVMAAFYYLLFGIMLSDAGYGLLMVIGCGIAKFGFKVKGKLKKTVDMYFWCGLATVFWGALFGSWFGDIVTRVATEFFHYTIDLSPVIPWAQPNSVALWFEPVNNPMKLMLFSFLFGIIHLFVGVGCAFYKMWKQGNKVGAVCDCVPVWLLISGLVPLGANIFQAGTFSSGVTGVAKWIAIAGAVLVVLTAGRDSKNIVGKLGLGLYGLYNTASGWLGDILSYSRLLALGLCTGVIATVVNTLGTIPQNIVVKACMLVPVFLFGHTVNIAINLIGTYVHTNRLQYVEFFSKFYEGGGRSFTPLKTNTKYYNVRED